MRNYLNRRNDPLDELVEAIQDLTIVLAGGREGVTKQDLETLEQNLTMKLSEIKALVAASDERVQEAFGEISQRLADLEQAAQDPEVTDEAFLADLQSLKDTVDRLADIVPDSETEEPGPAPTV